jgi:hypothetical protein
MRLTVSVVALVVSLLAAASAGAATRDVDVPDLFAVQLERARPQTTVPILLPQTLRSSFRRHFPEGRADAGAWRFDIGAVRGCGTATACFIAEFRGVRGRRPTNQRTVKLAGGRTGFFRPLRCGASCAPPSIQWRQHGALYTIVAKVGSRRTERRMLVRMANSAIRNGPR